MYRRKFSFWCNAHLDNAFIEETQLEHFAKIWFVAIWSKNRLGHFSRIKILVIYKKKRHRYCSGGFFLRRSFDINTTLNFLLKAQHQNVLLGNVQEIDFWGFAFWWKAQKIKFRVFAKWPSDVNVLEPKI